MMETKYRRENTVFTYVKKSYMEDIFKLLSGSQENMTMTNDQLLQEYWVLLHYKEKQLQMCEMKISVFNANEL
jgi:hypothetical protein